MSTLCPMARILSHNQTRIPESLNQFRGLRSMYGANLAGEKLRSGAPLGRDALFPTIDAMPMRRDETARRP